MGKVENVVSSAQTLVDMWFALGLAETRLGLPR